jgi:hypothetical protein
MLFLVLLTSTALIPHVVYILFLYTSSVHASPKGRLVPAIKNWSVISIDSWSFQRISCFYSNKPKQENVISPYFIPRKLKYGLSKEKFDLSAFTNFGTKI